MSQHVEAIIVAGGFGSRLQPLTTRGPKHLLNVGGVPFLEHQISRLAGAGVDHIVLATSYHAELFEPVLGNGDRWGVQIDYVQEDEPLGTAGAIRNVAGALADDPDGAVVILNGDILSAHDLVGQLADFDRPRGGRQVDVSLHLVQVDDARAFGCVPTDTSGRVTGFVEKSDSPISNQINAGCYIFRRRVIGEIEPGRVVSVERETFPDLVAGGRLVVGYLDSAYWRDVGTPSALVSASKDLVLGVATSPAVPEGSGAARVAEGASVADSAVLENGSLVAPGVIVGAGALVSGSVLMSDAVIGERARVVDSVVGPGAMVGDGAQLVQATLGDGCRVTAGTELAPGARVDCDAVV